MNGSNALPPTSARHSLRWRLPLLISGLIALALAASVWAAYRQVEAALVLSGGARAQSAADQVASLLDGQATLMQLQQISVDPVLRRFLQERSDEARNAARARLLPLVRSGTRRIEMWDAAGSLLLELQSSEQNPDGVDATDLPAGGPPSAPGIAELQRAGNLVFMDVVADVRGEKTAGAPPPRLGSVRVRLTFEENPPGVFKRLVGDDASVLVGNRSGSVWTDFSGVVPAPGVDLGQRGPSQYRDASGEMRLGALTPIRATPFAAWVDFPLADITAPARGFLNDMAVMAAIVLVAAAFLGTALAWRITTPLSEITRAAAGIAAGDYSHQVDASRRDEIGQLGRTFNTMAAEIRAASEALRKSEKNYRRLFASNPNPMWVYDVDTLRFLDVNEMAMAHYGYSREEFLSMTIADIRPPEEMPALLENLAQVQLPVERSGTWKHRKKDGTLIDVEIASHALTLDGRNARVVLVHDVTQRLAAERALQEREALFRGMAETMPHIVWTARPDGTFDYFNSRWFEYTRLEAPAAEAGWQAAVHPDDWPQVAEAWAHAIVSGEPYDASYRLKRGADGAYRWHRGRAAPLTNDKGEIALWVGTSTDVDDARRAEEALKSMNVELEQRVRARTRELEAANEELEAFSYSVSHDLRAPLRHVQGYVGMLVAATAGRLDEKALRYLGVIKDATVEMGALIDDLLAFSRISRVPMTPGRVSLDDLVASTRAGLEMATRGRNIVWTVPPLPHVVGDPSMLKQVFANLLGNAIKYTRPRDPAVIEIGCAGEEDGRLVLFVRDNGAGFDMQYAHKLFGVFQRLHRADEFEGTGIGLAIVRRVISRHGGRTWAEAKVDKGATIYFTLQPAPEPPAAA